MSADINHVSISGNITRDPELRVTQAGMEVLKFGIAVNDRRKNSNGDWEDVANFIECTMFGKRADSLSRYISKGDKLFISGKLHYSSWEKDGQNRSKIDVIVNDVVVSKKNSNQQGEYSNFNNSTYSAPQTPVVDVSASVYDEDIPF